MGKVIVFASGKGGTGKSTVAAAVGISLARLNKKVLIVDCDSGMRSLDLLLGIDRSLVFDISDMVSGRCSMDSVIYEVRPDFPLFFVPAPLNSHDELSPAVFKEVINDLKQYYDFVLIDSPAGVGKGFETSFQPADTVAVVINTEPTSTRGCVNIRKRLLAAGIVNIRMVINRFNRRRFNDMGLYSDLDEVIDEAQTQLIAVIPEDFEMIVELQKGRQGDAKSPAMTACMNLARRLNGEEIPLAYRLINRL